MRTSSILLVAVIAGCGPTSTGDQSGEIRWTDRVRFPERDEGLVSTEISQDFSEVVLRYQHPPRSPIAPGDIVTGTQDGAYLLAVTDVEHVDDTTVRLHTAGVPLLEAITDVDVSYDSRVDGVVPIARSTQTSANALTSSLDFQLADYASAVVSGIENARIDFEDSELSVAPEIRAQLVISEGKLQVFEVEIDACAHLRAIINMQAVGGPVLSGAKVKLPLKVESLLWLGPVPATLTLEPEVNLDLAMEDGSSARQGIDANICFLAGGHYDGSTQQFTPSWDVTVDSSVVGPELHTGSEMSLVVGVGPHAALHLFGVVGPTIAATLYGKGAVFADGGQLAWQMSAGIDANVGIDLQVPGGFIEGLSFEHEFPVVEYPLASGRLGTPPVASCGDGSCSNGETCSTCPGDCGACTTACQGALSDRVMSVGNIETVTASGATLSYTLDDVDLVSPSILLRLKENSNPSYTDILSQGDLQHTGNGFDVHVVGVDPAARSAHICTQRP